MRGATLAHRLVEHFDLFQSTLLMRGATVSCLTKAVVVHISIHAPHARSDRNMPLRRIEPSYFNPRSSCEERPAREKPSRRQGRISIHAPHARSDPPCRIRCAMSSAKISIHAPHARSDYYTTYTAQKSRNFNPRSSCEERLALNAAADAKAYISIHAPHARSDKANFAWSCTRMISIHAPHARSDVH